MSKIFSIALFALSLFAGAAHCQDVDKDKEKDEAAQVQKILTDNKLDTIAGTLNLLPVEEGKQPAKVVGTLATKTIQYSIQLLRPEQYKDLVKFDKQVVNMQGHVVVKEGQGATIYFEELEFAASRAGNKKKRGGL